MKESVAGVSSHYLGDNGQAYAKGLGDPLGPRYQLNLDYFLPHLRKDDRVLEFGCGNGGMLRLLAQHVAEAEGIEVNPHAAALARGLGLQVVESLSDLPRERPYTAVVSNHVLEHVRDAAAALEQLRSCMTKGGRLLMKLPIDDWRDRHQQGWSRTDIDHHIQTWTPRLIANLLYESGFEVDNVRVVTAALDPRLLPLAKVGLAKAAFWALAVYLNRRQLFVQGRVP